VSSRCGRSSCGTAARTHVANHARRGGSCGGDLPRGASRPRGILPTSGSDGPCGPPSSAAGCHPCHRCCLTDGTRAPRSLEATPRSCRADPDGPRRSPPRCDCDPSAPDLSVCVGLAPHRLTRDYSAANAPQDVKSHKMVEGSRVRSIGGLNTGGGDAVRDSSYPRIGIAMMTGSPPPASPPTSAVITIGRRGSQLIPPVRGTDTCGLHVARCGSPPAPRRRKAPGRRVPPAPKHRGSSSPEGLSVTFRPTPEGIRAVR
jgi:hypothetical protein